MTSSTWQAICADKRRYCRDANNQPGLLKMLVSIYGLRASAIYRFGLKLRSLSRSPAIVLTLPLWPLYWIAAAITRHGYGIHLSLSAEIGPGLYIGHLGGIYVGHCTLGEQCSIGQQTKIGDPSTAKANGPRLGSRVWVGAHSKIQGRVNIGDGATIGAGARVLADVPPHTLVMGDPARPINRDYDNTSLLML